MAGSPHRWRLAALPILSAGLLAASGAPQAPFVRSHDLRIEAGDFAFSPALVEVETGSQVTLTLVATDYVHGLYLEGYDLNLVADPGEPKTLAFTADRPGTFRFRCSVSCGTLHPFMTGRLRVGPNLFPLAFIVAVAAAVMGGTVAWRRPSTPQAGAP